MKTYGGTDLSVADLSDELHVKTCCGCFAALATKTLFTFHNF